MTKALVKGANNPLVVGDAFDTFFGHTTEMATYYGWCIPLSDMMKWYNWRAPESAVSVKEGIDNLLGRKGKDYFETLMRDINGQGRAEPARGGAAADGVLPRGGGDRAQIPAGRFGARRGQPGQRAGGQGQGPDL